MKKEELIRDEDYSEKDAEIMILKNKLDKAYQRIETLEDELKFYQQQCDDLEMELGDIYE